MDTQRPLQLVLKEFFDHFEWIHICLGLFGNFTFFAGSILFFYEPLKTAGIWLFVIGSFLMMVGSIGEALRKYSKRGNKQKMPSSSGSSSSPPSSGSSSSSDSSSTD